MQKASKLSKKSKNLRIDIDNLKSQKDDSEEKIKRVSSTTSAKFKGKKIRHMKREVNKLNESIKERMKELEKIERTLTYKQCSKQHNNLKKARE